MTSSVLSRDNFAGCRLGSAHGMPVGHRQLPGEIAWVSGARPGHTQDLACARIGAGTIRRLCHEMTSPLVYADASINAPRTSTIGVDQSARSARIVLLIDQPSGSSSCWLAALASAERAEELGAQPPGSCVGRSSPAGRGRRGAHRVTEISAKPGSVPTTVTWLPCWQSEPDMSRSFPAAPVSAVPGLGSAY
jgi:hypothetical protein